MAHGASEEFWKGKLEQLTEDLKENAQSLQKQTRRVKEDAASDGKTSDGKDWWDTSFNPKLQKQIDLVNELEKKLHLYLAAQAFQKANRVQELWKELKIAEKKEHAQQGDIQALQGLVQGKLQTLQAQKQKAQEENNMAHKELEDLQSELQTLQAQKQKAQEENTKARKELEDLQGKLQTLQAQKQKAQEENNMAHKELEYIQIRSAGRTLRAKNQELQQWQQRFMVVTVLSIIGLVAWVCQLVRKTRRLPEGTQNTQPLLDRSVEEQLLRNSASVLSILNQVRCILAHLRGDSPWHFVDDPEHPAD